MLGNKGTGRAYRDGGCRGGANQFKWEDVKSDAGRESYLGHSLHAPVGRWQRGKDLQWYSKGSAGKGATEHATQNLSREEKMAIRKAEIAAIKAQEDDLLNEGLGLAPKRRCVGVGVGARARAFVCTRDPHTTLPKAGNRDRCPPHTKPTQPLRSSAGREGSSRRSR